MNAVELRHVSKRFGQTQAVRDVSLEIGENEFFSLLGPSGCGKTTILRMIGGFEQPTTGQVCLMGHLVNGVPPHRRNTNLVFQHLALFPHLDVFDNVAFGLRVKRLDARAIRAKVQAMLDIVDLHGFGARAIHELSGGQKQRVAIARALVNEPRVLLLDEPLGALDLRLRVQMQAELKEIQHRVGTTFVYVTHDQTEALAMSDRIAVMRDGAVEQIGAGQDVYDRPQTAFVATFVGDSNLLDAIVEQIRPDAIVVVSAGLRLVTAPNASAKVGERVKVSVRPERIRLTASACSDPAVENGCPVKIRSFTFKGAFIEFRLTTISKQALTAHVPAQMVSATPFSDEGVAVWKKDDCVTLTA